MSDRFVARTVIRMTLAYFRANDTHLQKKTLKPHISESETTTTIQRRYCHRVMQLGVVLQVTARVDGISDLDIYNYREGGNIIVAMYCHLRPPEAMTFPN